MIRRFHLTVSTVFLFVVTTWLAGQSQQEPVRSTFERLASQIVVLGPDQFIYGFRDNSQIPPKEFVPVREFTQFLEDGNWTKSDFLALLKHNDAKVRTLALVALYSLDDPQVLPDIFPLVTDQASTFVAMLHFAAPSFVETRITPETTQKQTVGRIASAIIDAYMKSGGFNYGPLGKRGQPGFQEYWKLHAGRSTSAGWWSVRLARASHSTSPTQRDRFAPIRQLRAQIDLLPEPDRTWTLLRLNDDTGSDVLVPHEELVRLLKDRGPDSLMDLLKRNIRSNDPDLQPRQSPYGRMCIFILQNSASLLRPSDAKDLLDQEAWERDFQKHRITDPLISPWWAIAAAQLNSTETVAILRRGYEEFQGPYDGAAQLELAYAVWRLSGESEAPLVADWIYSELARHMGVEPDMLEEMLRTAARRNEILARTLIEDARFDDLNWKSLEVLAKVVNSWTGQEVVAAKEMESAWSPLGFDFFMRDKTKALEQFPKEVGELTATLSRWRAALRARIPALIKK